ncbi:hypothetical protein E6B08_19315 [Pseudomonas putida]|uniref:Uncharacterized protein n=1 Tax=Pseudomonas putida TaxID=303 RepID=A0A4D6XCF9_PSEPU|nr:hypothetical protein [Pseudomonas putida]QCI13383.1 hypothetical protein E6B08_19315 [Pseudomonas putida]
MTRFSTCDHIKDGFAKAVPSFKVAPASAPQPEDDIQKKSVHTGRMNDMTREEIDTKLQLIEERLDRKVSDIANSVSDLQSANHRTVEALQNAKWWAIGTAIAVLAVFMGTLQWGLSAQKEENARFSAYIREDVKSIGDDVKEISKAVSEMRIRSETKAESSKN